MFGIRKLLAQRDQSINESLLILGQNQVHLNTQMENMSKCLNAILFLHACAPDVEYIPPEGGDDDGPEYIPPMPSMKTGIGKEGKPKTAPKFKRKGKLK